MEGVRVPDRRRTIHRQSSPKRFSVTPDPILNIGQTRRRSAGKLTFSAKFRDFHPHAIPIMASKLPARSFRAVSSSVRPRSTCLRASNLSTAVSQRRVLSTESSLESTQANETAKPRWSYTPPGAKAPFRLRYNPNRPEFPVNEDPAVLDQFYIRFLGNGGDKLLSEEIKWLAVTHKSFDQGRRGFNDRLAFLGMFGREKENSFFPLPLAAPANDIFTEQASG